jgi:hypothetical protein
MRYQSKTLLALIALVGCGENSRPEQPPRSAVTPLLTPQPSASPSDAASITVYVTKSGTKYHRAGCRYLRNSSIPMTLEDAAKAHSPCSVCKPPLK